MKPAMKAKTSSRSGSPAMSPTPKSPSKSALRSTVKNTSRTPTKTGAKLSTKASPAKAATKSPAKDASKSPTKPKTVASPARGRPMNQPQTSQRQAMKKTSEKAKVVAAERRGASHGRAKSPKPSKKPSPLKVSPAEKGKVGKKQNEIPKTKDKSPGKTKSQGSQGSKRTSVKKTPLKGITKIKKKKIQRELSTSQFIDLWTLANIGKREASLNASMKVNIMYESTTKSPPKQSPGKSGNTTNDMKDEEVQAKTSPKKSTPPTKEKIYESEDKKAKSTMLSVSKGAKTKKLTLSSSLKLRQKNRLSSPSKKERTDLRKRNSPHYKIFKDEPVSKSRKTELKKGKAEEKSKAKAVKTAKKKKSKSAPSGHHLCNIIEKSPRQASLIAKAMIAMEQEEDVVLESAARTNVYDWQELRPQHQSTRRRIVWASGLVKSITAKEDKGDAKLDSTTSAGESSEKLQSTLLRTLHEVGDPRLLREFYRAQRDDFPGLVDVEKCDPAPPPPAKQAGPPTATVSPVKEAVVSPVKVKPLPINSAGVPPAAKKSLKVSVSEKSDSSSPAKPQPCRVATPIPQFPLGRRTSHMTSFVHHPMSPQQQQQHYNHQQHLHKQQQDQQKQAYPQKQAPQPAHTHHPQPIKVTPYSPSPAFIYQFVPPPPPSPSPSPLSYSLSGTASPAPHGDFQSSFTLSHMGSLSLGRRGVNPYEPAYNNSMQQVGYGFPSYYPSPIPGLHQSQNMQSLPNLPSLQSLQNLSAMPGLQNLSNLQPMGVQQFPLVQPAPMVAHQQLSRDVTQFNPLVSNLHTFSPLRDGAGFARPQPMMPPPAHSHKPAHSPMGPPPAPPITPSSAVRPATSPQRHHSQHHLQQHHHSLQQQQQHQQQLRQSSPIESLRTMNPHGVQPILQSRVLQFASGGAASFQQPQTYHALAQPVQHPQANLLPKPTNSAKATSISPQAKQQMCSTNNLHFVQAHASHCKKEFVTEHPAPSCDITPKPHTCNAEVQTKPAIPRRTSTEVSDISDLLHSAHNAMFETESGTPPAQGRDTLHPPSVSYNSDISTSNGFSSDNHIKTSVAPAPTAFSAAYSVSTLLDLPSQKLKSEPQVSASCEFAPQVMQNSLNVVVNSPSNLHIAFPSNIHNRATSEQAVFKGVALVKKEQEDKPKAEDEDSQSQKQDKVPLKRKADAIVIEDSEESSEDEPLAKLVIRKAPVHKVVIKPMPPRPSGKPALVKSPSKVKVGKTFSSNGANPKRPIINTKNVKVSPIKSKENCKVTPIKLKIHKSAKLSPVKLQAHKKTKKVTKAKVSISPLKKAQNITRKNTVKRAGKTVKAGSSKPKKPTAKKARLDFLNAQSLARPINNHGWSWIGEGEVGPVPKLTISREESVRMRRCFKSMRHASGEQVAVGDCVLLQSDGTDANVPYVARVTRLWEALNGEKMFSMLWYYQPEHTATGREAEDGEQELFASKHREENSVACIDDKCYVLMYNEYCRLEAEAARNDQGVSMPRWREEMPGVSSDDQALRRRPTPSNACVDNIWFCRYDYDIRKKYVRKPKHKKSNLRYRAPSKLA